MKKLLKQYGLNSDMQYFELITDSFVNGQRKQALNMFIALPKTDKINFLKASTVGGWDSGLSPAQITECFNFFFFTKQ